MSTTKYDIRTWLNRAKEKDAEFLIVVCDTYDWSDYPVYVTAEQFAERYNELNGKNMQEIMEVYDLSLDWEMQLNERRAFHYPANFIS
jgi:hypothetical protein